MMERDLDLVRRLYRHSLALLCAVALFCPPWSGAATSTEADRQAATCRRFLTAYGPRGLDARDVKVALRLDAGTLKAPDPDDADALRRYRKKVKIAYLIVNIDTDDWGDLTLAHKKRVSMMFMPLMKSLYPRADLFLTVYDGEDAVANSSWKRGAVRAQSDVGDDVTD